MVVMGKVVLILLFKKVFTTKLTDQSEGRYSEQRWQALRNLFGREILK